MKSKFDYHNLLRQVPVPDQAKEAVAQRLYEPHRCYHNIDHVLEMWGWHKDFSRGKFDSNDEKIVASFCLYHDAIYDPTALGDSNERASAELWLVDSAEIVPEPVRRTVAASIYASADHFAIRTEGNVVSWCLDLDLLRLGSANFVQHGHDIRTEYPHLSEQQWLVGSSMFRAKVMGQPKIFMHNDFADAEVQARRNLSKALVEDWRALGYLTVVSQFEKTSGSAS